MKESIPPLFLIFLFALISCSKDTPRISSTHFSRADQVYSWYLFDREDHDMPLVVNGTAQFQYLGSKVVKRIGGSIPVISAGGIGGIHTTVIYDTVEYTAPNEITIESKDNSDYFDVYPLPRVITLEDGRVARKITYGYKENGYNAANDTIYYSYSENGFSAGNVHRLIKTVQYLRGLAVTRDYSYDPKGNLQNITTVTNSRYTGYADTAKEIFGGYDDKPNPLRGVCLWEDLLYRTLSTNNFTTYTYKRGSDFESKNWKLVYDNEGNVDYSN
jgi:hypothetical protein